MIGSKVQFAFKKKGDGLQNALILTEQVRMQLGSSLHDPDNAIHLPLPAGITREPKAKVLTVETPRWVVRVGADCLRAALDPDSQDGATCPVQSDLP